MGKDGTDTSGDEIGRHLAEVERQAVGEFDHEIFLVVAIAEELSCKPVFNGLGVDHDFSRGDEFDGAADFFQLGSYLLCRPNDTFWSYVGPAFILMRGRRDHAYSFIPRDLCHGDDLIHVFGAIIKAGTKMAVSVNKHVFERRVGV